MFGKGIGVWYGFLVGIEINISYILYIFLKKISKIDDGIFFFVWNFKIIVYL